MHVLSEKELVLRAFVTLVLNYIIYLKSHALRPVDFRKGPTCTYKSQKLCEATQQSMTQVAG